MREDPKSKKKTDNLPEFFTVLGSALVKAACKTLVDPHLPMYFVLGPIFCH